MKTKFILIRPPRYYWPFINEYDNFILPQSLACLAAVLRRAGISVKVIDCMPMKMGWKTLGKVIRDENPDIIGIGDSESLYSHEAVKALNLAKEINKDIITVAGGAHFSNLAEDCLKNYPIDFIVRGEGEETIVELASKIINRDKDFEMVNGIVFKRDGHIVETAPRRLIDNLDDLPLPAYDIMPMDKYGRAKFLFTPGGITIHHSRGCVNSCDFCVWWVQMAERSADHGKLVLKPRWRTKSVKRTIEEIELLHNKYHQKFLIFVDDSWNINPDWSNEFAESIIKKKIKVKWFAFMRADLMVRDDKLGIMKKLVKAGLSHVSIGAERADNGDLSNMGKNFYKTEIVREAMGILSGKYPQVFRQATFIVGVRNETKESMLSQLEYARELKADYPAFHPITPVPGTKLWDEANKKGWLEVKDFSYYDWSTPVMASEHLSRSEIDYLLYFMNKKYASFTWLLKGIFNPYTHKRNMYIWCLIVAVKMFLDSVFNLINPFRFKEYNRLMKPKWYDK
ncbi:MAG: radical SAM protein [Candidatus Omnitrophota bacterium]|jgi:anaerobic magnesium-protoporphyrin IX monomethyl ester cyclase